MLVGDTMSSDSRDGVDAFQRARAIVLRHGWNATCYQVLNPGIVRWFAPSIDAVVGFVTSGRTRVVAGAPICAEENLPEVVALFERDAAADGRRVCYFGAEARLETLLHGSPSHAAIPLGAQPAWDPAGWEEIIARRASLRGQLNRSRNKGVRVEEWSAERATLHPDLVRCLREWLDTRPLPPLHFLVEPDTLGRIYDRRVFVAERAGVVVSFLVASPVPCRNGWLVEQIIRGRGAPNGTAELLIDTAMRAFAAEEYSYVTLGLSPLSRRGTTPPATPTPPTIAFLLTWARAHGKRFYNFEGLDAFKSKFSPHRWEPVYAFANERRFSLRSLYAIARAFSQGSPVLTVGRGVVRALSSRSDV
jgi:phosphatidylglycerol lysyltransferase